MHIMNTQGTLKRPVTMEKLLGKQSEVREISTEERDKKFAELLEKFEA